MAFKQHNWKGLDFLAVLLLYSLVNTKLSAFNIKQKKEDH